MQPQQPTQQAPAPAPTPETPAAPTPPAQPAGTPPTPPQPGKKPSNKLVIAIIAAVVVIVVAVGAYFVIFRKQGLALDTFSNDQFSLSVPKGYERRDIDGGIVFSEPGDQQTASVVFASYSAFPEPVDQEQLDIIKDALTSDPQTNLQSITGTSDEIEDTQITETKFKGVDALQITGRGVKDGQTTGRFKMVMVLNTEAVYLVGVGAHSSDPAIETELDEIIDSFTIKQ